MENASGRGARFIRLAAFCRHSDPGMPAALRPGRYGGGDAESEFGTEIEAAPAEAAADAAHESEQQLQGKLNLAR